MTRVLRVGIVGSGFGVVAHLPAVAAHPGLKPVALASPNRAAAVAREGRIPNAFRSCAEMLAGCEVDAVIVASPPFAHYDDVLAALAAGKHVLCEKPFALDVAQAEAMLAASRGAGTACGIAHEFRWVPQRAAIKELIVNGHLDPLRELELTQLSGMRRASHERENGWIFRKATGGGVAGALLSHLVDTANWWAGRAPLRSTGYLRTANPVRHGPGGAFTTDVDDGAFALLDYGEGLIARVTVDATTAVDSLTLGAHAENRTAIASGTSLDEMRLFAVDQGETSELECTSSPYARFASLGGNVPLLMQLYDEWILQIRTGASALPAFAEGVQTQRTLAAVGYGV